MNERIFELAEKAEEYATTRHPVSNIALSVNSENFVKKFAELIVRECFKAAMIESKGHMNPIDLMKRMKERVGVEE